MKVTFFLWRGSSERNIQCRFFGTLIGWILAALAMALVAGSVWCVSNYLHNAYFPYQGEVVAIRTSWAEWFIFEFVDDEHLTIRTSEGKTIDRVVPTQIRIMQSIGVGDQVVKEKGFRNQIRLREKRTVQ